MVIPQGDGAKDPGHLDDRAFKDPNGLKRRGEPNGTQRSKRAHKTLTPGALQAVMLGTGCMTVKKCCDGLFFRYILVPLRWN